MLLLHVQSRSGSPLAGADQVPVTWATVFDVLGPCHVKMWIPPKHCELSNNNGELTSKNGDLANRK